MANFKKVPALTGKTSHFHSNEEKMLYRLNSSKKSTIYLRCIENGCKARAKIEQDTLTRTNDAPHNHRHHEDIADAEKIYAELKQLAVTSKRPIRELQMEKLRDTTMASSGLVAWDKVRGTLNRLRRETMPACPDLQTFVELLESNEMVKSAFTKIRQTDFYAGNVDGCIIFCNQELISATPERFDMFVDGTFSVAPFHAPQLLIVLAEIEGMPRPVAYIIMPDRLKKTYISLFEFLRDAAFCFDGIQRTPATFMSDFERASRQAANSVWPDIELIGCNFHFCQALRRKASSLPELCSKIRGQTLHHTTLKLFMRLSLLPLESVFDGLDALKLFLAEKGVAADFHRFLNYFERVWLRHYEPSTWCVSVRKRRTNCNLEGYNAFIKQKIHRNPSPWVFVNAILDLAYDASSKLERDLTQRTQRADRSRLTKPMEANLKLLEDGEISIIEFLQAMAAKTPFVALPRNMA